MIKHIFTITLLFLLVCSSIMPGSGLAAQNGQLIKLEKIEVQDINSNTTRVIITTSGPVQYKHSKYSNPDRIVINLRDLSHSWSPRSWNVVSGNVTEIRSSQFSFKPELVTRIVIHPKNLTSYEIVSEHNQVIVEINSMSSIETVNGVVSKPEPESEKVNSEKLIFMDLNEADLNDVLRLLALQNNLNIIQQDKVKGKKGSFYFSGVTYVEALDHILNNNGFQYTLDEKTVTVSARDPLQMDTRLFILRYADPFKVRRILLEHISDDGKIEVEKETKTLIITDTNYTFNTLVDLIEVVDKETKAAAKVIDQSMMQETVTRIFRLQYINVSGIKDILGNFMSDKGTLEVDAPSNSLLVSDSGYIVKRIEDLVAELDIEPPQVMIQIEVVEINLSAITDIGIKWQYVDDSFTATMNRQYFTEPLSEDVDNLGMSSSNTGGSLIFGKVTDKFRGIISSLITDNNAELLAAPRITVINNQKASIEITEEFPYNQLTGFDQFGNPEYSVQFLNIGINLVVTPNIRPGNVVSMELAPEVSYQQGENIGIPIKAVRKAVTHVSTHDGKSIVIGGLMSNKKLKTVQKVPLLGSIPVLGRLFRSDKDTYSKVELLIFVTPYIINNKSIKEMKEQRDIKLEKFE